LKNDKPEGKFHDQGDAKWVIKAKGLKYLPLLENVFLAEDLTQNQYLLRKKP
jgi:hypothetical protein